MSSWTSVATPQPPRRFPSQNRGVLTIALPVTTRICNRIIAVYFKINSSIFAQYWLGKINAHVTNGDSLKTKMGVVLKYEKYERFDPVFCLLGHHSKTSDGGSLALILLLRISHQLSIFGLFRSKSGKLCLDLVWLDDDPMRARVSEVIYENLGVSKPPINRPKRSLQRCCCLGL